MKKMLLLIGLLGIITQSNTEEIEIKFRSYSSKIAERYITYTLKWEDIKETFSKKLKLPKENLGLFLNTEELKDTDAITDEDIETSRNNGGFIITVKP